MFRFSVAKAPRPLTRNALWVKLCGAAFADVARIVVKESFSGRL
ncbi:hypothetical protein CES86_4929 [Brucella lupini]|uniref:Uncharacterized protein n=1 Tax=Brucella lupini TaxID=255457 RepID=A0A256GDD5_9HYPH|nr:hypothetical protein CES86_4929 [Brucella lupini]